MTKHYNEYICSMNITGKLSCVLAVAIVAVMLVFNSSCKNNKKEDTATTTPTDTAAQFNLQPSNTLTLPHADSAVIPELTLVLDQAFAASGAKDYNKLASLIVYRGPDEKRMGYDVFNAKNSFDKSIVKVTSDVFNKWNRDVSGKEYTRAFELDQPDGRKMTVLEVIFVTPKTIDRKFFGFLKINEEWKIADVTSYL